MESLGGVLERVLPGDSLVLLGNLTTEKLGAGMTGRDGAPDLNHSGVLLLDCASQGLAITDTVFEVAHKCTWYQNTLG